jgi:2,3-diketo-5-methylthio-1-phosphopentane phosphatase
MNTNSNNVFKIFVDFDGTISRQDIGEEMFLTFGKPSEVRKIIEAWINDEITSTESWIEMCKTVTDFSEARFDEFLSKIEIDPHFKGFLNYCKRNEFEILVLSDGLDYYINKFLSKENIDGLTVYSNKLNIDSSGILIPEFPYTDEECKKCANCKRNHILTNSGDDEYTVYIGDGYSDTCPAQYCDFIFAKSSLLKYCEINRVSYFPYNDFGDVISRLEGLKKKKRLKKRFQAELKRRAVYQAG